MSKNNDRNGERNICILGYLKKILEGGFRPKLEIAIDPLAYTIADWSTPIQSVSRNKSLI